MSFSTLELPGISNKIINESKQCISEGSGTAVRSCHEETLFFLHCCVGCERNCEVRDRRLEHLGGNR